MSYCIVGSTLVISVGLFQSSIICVYDNGIYDVFRRF